MWSSNLPYVDSLLEYRPPIISEIYSDNGEIIGRFWEEKRIVIPTNHLPQHLIKSFVAAEDARFFKHEGVDLLSIIRALFKNLMAGKIEQGGSTITQQVTRSLFLNDISKTYRRKFREALLSVQIEKKISKERILFLYLNQIYLGEGAYGIEAAARTYFGKSAQHLNLAESALLAGLPQAPAKYSPVKNFHLAKRRQKYVLERMREEGYITEKEMKEALGSPVLLKQTQENPFEKAPYYTEHVRQYILKKYGHDLLYRGGLKVYTHLNIEIHKAAEEAIRKGLMELDKREGYRGPIRHLLPEQVHGFIASETEKFLVDPLKPGAMVQGLVEKVDDKKAQATVLLGKDKGLLPLSEMRWARKPDSEIPHEASRLKRVSDALKEGDVVLVRIKKEGQSPFTWEVGLEQIPEVQGALFCMEPETGRAKAMVGGWDYSLSQFNRAIQSRRQPGSAFKPIIYAAALDWGMTPAEILIDAPFISGQDADDEHWKPKNYKGKFYGPTLFRAALAHSRNVITVKILKKIGVQYAIQYAKRMGIESHLSPDLSLALGSSGLSLMEITRSYAVFDNKGMLVEPIFVDRIVDRSGRVIEETQPVSRQVLSEDTAYVMTDLLKAVIQEGTGWRIRALKRPVAGKTGTTNDLRDAWFIGYIPNLVTGVWVGYDDRKPMGAGETGSRAASPIWLYFMSKVVDGQPIMDFAVPEGVVFARIDAGVGLLASPYSEKTVFQAFKKGTEPKEHSPKPGAPKSGHFAQFDMEDSR